MLESGRFAKQFYCSFIVVAPSAAVLSDIGKTTSVIRFIFLHRNDRYNRQTTVLCDDFLYCHREKISVPYLTFVPCLLYIIIGQANNRV